MNEYTCEICGKKVIQKYKSKYCSEECKILGRNKIQREWRRKNSNSDYMVPEIKICQICEKEFTAIGINKKRMIYCSDECRKKGRNKKSNEYHKANSSSLTRKNVQRRKPALSIGEISKRAREAGMTYGKYVAMMEAQNGNDRKGNC